MSHSVTFALFGLAFCGLVILELKTGEIWTPVVDASRDKWPVLYWLIIGVHVFIAAIGFVAAIASYLQTI